MGWGGVGWGRGVCVCVCVCVAKPVAVELRCHATALIYRLKMAYITSITVKKTKQANKKIIVLHSNGL